MSDKIELKVPAIDIKALERQAFESAQKGALEEIIDYYESWQSSYRKGIKEILSKQDVDNGTFCFPQIIGLINTAISAEVDRIVNTAIAQTYLPMVTDILVGIDKELNLSDIIETIKREIHSNDEIYAEVGKNERYDWYELHLRIEKKSYDITLHKNSQIEGKYHLLSMPFRYSSERNYTLYLDDNKRIELPLEANVIHDPVAKMCARLLIADTQIAIDFDGEYYFEDEYND